MEFRKQTLSEQIYQILRNDILQQNIKCGERLTLKVLQNRFGVSSTPIREALTRLVQDNLAIYYSNVGIEVIQLTEHDLQELYQFMGALDALAIEYASAHPDQTQLLADLAQNSISARTALRENRQEDWLFSSDRFHLIFYDYCQNGRLTESACRLRSQLTIFSNQYGMHSVNQEQIQLEHDEIYALYKEKNFSGAVQKMREHLMNSLAIALQEISPAESCL